MPPRFPAHTLTTEPALTTAMTEAKKLCVREGEKGGGSTQGAATFGARIPARSRAPPHDRLSGGGRAC